MLDDDDDDDDVRLDILLYVTFFNNDNKIGKIDKF